MEKLNGLWAIDFVAEWGSRADGVVALYDGAVVGKNSAIDIDGSYEALGDAIIAGLDVVLHGPGRNGRPTAECVHLHVQGSVTGRTISASGIDLADDTRHVRIYLEWRGATPAAMAARRSDRGAGAELKAMWLRDAAKQRRASSSNVNMGGRLSRRIGWRDSK